MADGKLVICPPVVRQHRKTCKHATKVRILGVRSQQVTGNQRRAAVVLVRSHTANNIETRWNVFFSLLVFFSDRPKRQIKCIQSERLTTFFRLEVNHFCIFFPNINYNLSGHVSESKVKTPHFYKK